MQQPQSTLLDNLLHPAKLEISRENRIKAWEGDPKHYGFLPDQILGEDVTDYLPCLFGLEENHDTRFLYVNISDELTADLHIQWNHDGYSLLLLDSSERKSSQQEVQQVAHELGLLYEKLEELTVQLKQQNTALDEANQAKSLFISGISHEFRTPMISILGHLTWLGRDIDKESEQFRSIKSIDRSANYLLSLIDNLLHQGKIEADTVTPNLKSVELQSFFDHLVDTIKPLATDKGLSVIADLEDIQTLDLLLDEYHVHQALLNILSNAVKYTRQGQIAISATYQNQRLIVDVADTGIGIPRAAQQDLFKPFTRASNSADFQGAGLGLSIVKGLVDQMQGSLDIDSAIGEGTRVHIEIPAETAQKALPEEASDQLLEEPKLKGPVFIVDDNTDILAVYELFFDEAQLHTEMFSTPADFLAATLEHHPPLVLMDYNLGRENGIDIASSLRAAGYEGRIIMLTATAAIDPKLLERAVVAGCTQFIPKPMDVQQLVALTIQELNTL